MVAVTIFEARRCRWIPKKYFTGVFWYYWKEETIHVIKKVTLGNKFLTWLYYQGKNWLNLEMIKVFISIINKTIPECKIISAPALREYSRIYNNLIEKVKLWKKQGVKVFGFITNVWLDRSRVVMASSMVSVNHCSCVHINLETGDELYADSIGREVPCNFGNTFSNFFQAICKVCKKRLYQTHASCLWNSVNKKRAQMRIFLCKKCY